MYTKNGIQKTMSDFRLVVTKTDKADMGKHNLRLTHKQRTTDRGSITNTEESLVTGEKAENCGVRLLHFYVLLPPQKEKSSLFGRKKSVVSPMSTNGYIFAILDKTNEEMTEHNKFVMCFQYNTDIINVTRITSGQSGRIATASFQNIGDTPTRIEPFDPSPEDPKPWNNSRIDNNDNTPTTSNRRWTCTDLEEIIKILVGKENKSNFMSSVMTYHSNARQPGSASGGGAEFGDVGAEFGDVGAESGYGGAESGDGGAGWLAAAGSAILLVSSLIPR